MRKLFGATLVVAIIFVLVSILLGNRELPNEPSRSDPVSAHSPQTSYEDNRLPINENTSAEDTDAQNHTVMDILLVNAWNPLPDDFPQIELVTLFDCKNRHFNLAASDIQLDKSVYEAAGAMFAAAKQDGVDGFIVTSGYRSREKQAELAATDTIGIAAAPGQSEHATGLAFDVTTFGSENGFDKTPQFEWLIQNCWDYGFILRYPSGKESITGIPYEPWHYRYVGLPYSQTIRDLNITLEEYLGER